MSVWEILLLAVTVLVAVRSLVGMMRRRADRLVSDVQRQVDAHREREKAAKRRAKQADANNAA